MRVLETVLDERTPHLVRTLIRRGGLNAECAERFVTLAGSDLIESFLWNRSELAARPLAAPSTARDVLSTMGANRLASELGLTRSQVWTELRAFVPYVLCLAEGGEPKGFMPARPGPGPGSARPPHPRRLGGRVWARPRRT